MTLFRNVVFTAAIVGLFAGLIMTAMQSLLLDPIIFQAEIFEQATVGQESSGGHSHRSKEADHHEHNGIWAPHDGAQRLMFSALASIISSIGLALILVSFSEFGGGITSWRKGLFWGLAGFVTFSLAPNLGLAPDLPAMQAADLQSRQIWWVATAAATAVGLTLIFLQKAPALAIAGIIILILPHVIGAPLPESHESPVPANLHHRFVVLATVTSLIFWVVLGCTIAMVRNRLIGAPESDETASA